jgi:leucyl-tRNA synthetase
MQLLGADTFRMYLMFLGPYQEGGDFRDSGISGIRRFLDKVWGLVAEAQTRGGAVAQDAVTRLMHRTIQKVTHDTGALDYNTAISAMMEYVNALKTGTPTRAMVEPLVVMLAPYAPHFAEECWERLGHQTSVMDADWPAFDAALALEDEVEVVVQVNGKVRGRLKLRRGTPEKDAMAAAMADPAVHKFLDGKEIRKVIFVQDKLVSLVV